MRPLSWTIAKYARIPSAKGPKLPVGLFVKVMTASVLISVSVTPLACTGTFLVMSPIVVGVPLLFFGIVDCVFFEDPELPQAATSTAIATLNPTIPVRMPDLTTGPSKPAPGLRAPRRPRRSRRRGSRPDAHGTRHRGVTRRRAAPGRAGRTDRSRRATSAPEPSRRRVGNPRADR